MVAVLAILFGSCVALRRAQPPPLEGERTVQPPAQTVVVEPAPQASGATSDAHSPEANAGSAIVSSKDNTGFAIVFGADVSPDAAMDEVKKARKPPINAHPVLYKKGKYWNSAASFKLRNDADRQLAAFKGVWPTAFTVDLSTWCPAPRPISSETPNMAEQLDCGS